MRGICNLFLNPAPGQSTMATIHPHRCSAIRDTPERRTSRDWVFLSGAIQSDLFAIFQRIVDLEPDLSPCGKHQNVSFSHSQLPLPSRDKAQDEYNGEASDWQRWSI